MAITFDTLTQNGYSLVGSATLSITVAANANRWLGAGFVMYSEEGDPSVTTATFNGVAMTFVGKKKITGNPDTAFLYGIVAPATGAHDVVIDFDQTDVYCGMAVFSYYGVHQTVPTGTATQVEGGTAAVSIDVASAVGDLCLDVLYGDTITTCFQTQVFDENSVGEHCFGSKKAGEATTTNLAWTLASGNWVAVGVALKPAGDIALSGAGGTGAAGAAGNTHTVLVF